MSPSTLRVSLRLVLAGCVLAALVLSLSIQFSYGGLKAGLSNSTNPAGSATLLYTHTYSGGTTCSSVPSAAPIPSTSTFACGGSIAPTTPTPLTGTATAPSDSIADRGSATATQVTERVSAASCAPVQLANSVVGTNPLLVRYGTTFAPSAGPMANTAGSITLDGATPGGYESAVTSTTQPNPALSIGVVYGLGVWFRTSATTGGPLFGIGTSPANSAGSDDRILFMNKTGTLGYQQNLTGATSAVTTTSAKYNDGTWHFAYVTMTNTLSLGTTTTIYVDGTRAATGGGLGVGYVADTGYWHLGWSPVSGLPSYFTGSLSDFVAFNGGNAPAAPTATQLASQTNFRAWASAATQLWPLNDTGTTTFAGPYPNLGTTSPCSTVNVSWNFSNPTSCGYSPASRTAACTAPPAASLAGFVTTPGTIASAAPGTTRTSTIALSRGSGYDTVFEPGLHLYAPLTFSASVGGWSNTFTWADATSAFIA